MTPAQLRMARALLQLGIRELADKAGVDKMSVQRIESGRRAHPPTMAKIKAALIEEGIVFLGAVEPLHEETVALRWGAEQPSAREESGAEDGEDDDPADDARTLSWDDADAVLDARQLRALREYWSDETRRNGLKQPSRRALAKHFGMI